MSKIVMALLLAVAIMSCQAPVGTKDNNDTSKPVTDSMIKPVVITDTVQFDTDDPAIWINPADPAASLVLGTDKDENGALYVFGLDGKEVPGKTVHGLKRPNNVDVAYGLVLAGKRVDIAVVSERLTNSLRVFSLPDMKPIGSIPTFEGETGEGFRDGMGIALYTDSAGTIYAIAGRKNGPIDGRYLWQYRLQDDGTGKVKGTLVRKFGTFSGKKEIEAIAVDNELGYVYYSDEGVGIRKYYADPAKGNAELALFGTTGFTQDHEGISIAKEPGGKGFILVSDQQVNQFKIFPREGTASNPHDHPMIKSLLLSTLESDGSDIVSVPLNKTFQHGLFVAMSTDKTFQFYRLEDLIGKGVNSE